MQGTESELNGDEMSLADIEHQSLIEMMTAGLDIDGEDLLHTAITNGAAELSGIDVLGKLDDEELEEVAHRQKSIGLMVLQNDVLAEKQRNAQMLRQLVMTHQTVKRLAALLKERDAEIEAQESHIVALTDVNQELTDERDALKRAVKLNTEIENAMAAEHDFEVSRSRVLHASVYALAHCFTGKGKGAVLAENIMDALKTFDNAKRPEPEDDDVGDGFTEGTANPVDA